MRTLKRSHLYLPLLIILFSVFFINVTFPGYDAQNNSEYQNAFNAKLLGYVEDVSNHNPVVNYSVEISGQYLLPKYTKTDKNGNFNISLPAGEFSIKIFYRSGIFYTDYFNLENEQVLYREFQIDSNRGQYKLAGFIVDADLKSTAIGYNVNVTIDKIEYGTTITDHLGYYELILFPGTYKLSISKDNKVYKEDQVEVLNVDIWENKTINEKAKKTGFEWITFDKILNDIIDNPIALIALIISLILLPIILSLLDRALERSKKKLIDWLDEKAYVFLENVIKYNVIIILILVIMSIIAWLFPDFDQAIWQHVWQQIWAIYTIIFLVILLRFVLMILKRVMDYLKGNLAKKPKLKISPRYIGLVEIILKYFLILIFGINILVIALTIFGMGDLISEAISDFFVKNSGYLTFVIVVILLMYFGGRFSQSFIEDMKKRGSSTFSPQIADMLGKVIKMVVYVFGMMIIIFAVLNMAGMGELGQTLILIISIVIGFVVSMAATGSLGNILTSFVLNAFRPYEVGDRVKIGNIIGDVESTNLAFVRLRTLNGEIVDIPNNNVISGEIYNYQKSGAFAVNVEVGIGYTVPSETVKKFLVEAARETKDILDDPRPYVIITKMGDYAINYLLRAYTDNAKIMFRVRSNLMANVQEEFYSHGVEILSPWYLVRRDEKIPTEKETMDTWKGADEKVEQIMSKEQEEQISDSFGMFEKTLSEEKQM